MKTYCKPKDVNIEDMRLIREGVWNCFEGKYRRADFQRVLLRTRAITKAELDEDIRRGSYRHRNDALEAVALSIRQDIIARDIKLRELVPFQKRDGMTKKVRDLCKEAPYQQILEYIAVAALQPLFRAKLFPFQFGSIPGRGQVKGKYAIEKIIRRKHKSSGGAIKSDVQKAYPSTKCEEVMKLLRRDIGKNKPLLWFIGVIMPNYPGGVLIIGGFLSTWLFNYVMSYALREMLASGAYRRGKWISDVKAVVCYADDTTVFGAISKLKRAVKRAREKIKAKLGLALKGAWTIVSFPSFKEEKENHEARRAGSHKRTRGLDMMGFVVRRGYTIIRKGIWRRIRRQLLRAWDDITARRKIPISRARRITSYGG